MQKMITDNWTLVFYIAPLLLLVVLTQRAWAKYKPSEQDKTKMREVAEREIAMNAVSAGVGAAITGGSIILGVIGAIAGLGNIEPSKMVHFRYAAILCAISLLAGVWVATVLPQYANTRNVASEPKIGVALAIQVYSMFLGMFSLVRGVWQILTK